MAIIGASGGAGSEVLRLALDADYHVTIVERNPDRVQPKENVTIVKGDVTDLGSLVRAFEHIDVVVSCFGPANGRKAGDLMSVGVTNLVRACEQNGVSRFVFMSGILQANGRELTFMNRLGVKLIRQFYQEAYQDKIVAEDFIQASSLQWVIVRAVSLAKSEPTRRYKAGIRASVAPFDTLPYADFALALLNAVEDPKWTRQIINVGKS